MSQTFAKPELPKRFYKDVGIAAQDGGGFAVLLDGRSVRTPARRPLVLPSAMLADDVADEWRAQGERIDPATMPLTRLVNTVLDGIADDPSPVRDDLAQYAETDLLFYRAGAPDRLVERQKEGWDPVLGWMEALLGVRFVLGEGVMHVAQPDTAVRAVRDRLTSRQDPFALAALHQITTLTGSAILALAVADARLDEEDAWRLAHIDEDWNRELWGEDEEATARRDARFAEMRAAARVLAAG